MHKLIIPALALLGLAACDDTGGDSGAAGNVTSCNWDDLNICYEWNGYDGGSDWCDTIADEYGFATTFSPGACPGNTIGGCDLDGVAFADNIPVTAYYYDGESDPVGACEDAGGSPF